MSGKPLLDHLIRSALAAGVEEYLVALGYLGERICDYFQDGSRFGVQIDYFRPENKGPEGALFGARPYLGDGDFCCFCADMLLLPGQISLLRRVHEDRQAAATFILDREDRSNPKRVRADTAGRIVGASRSLQEGVLTYNMVMRRSFLDSVYLLVREREDQSLALAMDELAQAEPNGSSCRAGLWAADIGEFVNINTPGDLVRAERFLTRQVGSGSSTISSSKLKERK